MVLRPHDFFSAQPIPSNHRGLLREVAELHPHFLLVVEIHSRDDTGPPVFPRHVRPTVFVGDQVDALAIPVVPFSGGCIKTDPHATAVVQRDPEALLASRIVDSKSEAIASSPYLRRVLTARL